MSLIVQKFGGATLAGPELMKGVARRIVETREQGRDVVVVVSAPGEIPT